MNGIASKIAQSYLFSIFDEFINAGRIARYRKR